MRGTWAVVLMVALGFVGGARAEGTPVSSDDEASTTSPAAQAGRKSRFEGHPQAAILGPVDQMAVAAMKRGYNQESSEAYYKDFSITMKAACSEAGFKALVVATWKSKWGKFQGRKLIEQECSFMPELGLVVYRAKFEKGVAKLSVNYTRDRGALKIMQIQIAPLGEAEK